MVSVFISYDHNDQKFVESIRGLSKNKNHTLKFVDRSLAEPVLNVNGHTNRRTPSDPASQPVRDAIQRLLSDSGKILVLLGQNTHSRKWVQWEVNKFIELKRNENRVLLMRIKNNITSGPPGTVSHLPVVNWNMQVLSNFCR